MHPYADSSFLVSCCVMDANTPRAKAWFSSAGVPLVFTELHALEIRNALKLGVFRRLFAAVDAAAAWRIVQSDVRSGRLITTTVKWSLAFRVASRLAEGHSMTLGTRSLILRWRRWCDPRSFCRLTPVSGRWQRPSVCALLPEPKPPAGTAAFSPPWVLDAEQALL